VVIAITAVHNPNSSRGSLSKEKIPRDGAVMEEEVGACTILDLGETLGLWPPCIVSVSLQKKRRRRDVLLFALDLR
jgi:hypothetical protein